MYNISFALGFWHGFRGQRIQPTLCEDAHAYSQGYEEGAIAAAMALSDHQQLARQSRQKRRDIAAGC